MEPELATKMIVTSRPLAAHLQEIFRRANIEAGDHFIVMALICYAATLANKTKMEAFDFLQLCDTAFQVMDPGDPNHTPETAA